MVNKERAANMAALNDAFRQQPLLKGKLLSTLAILPRHATIPAYGSMSGQGTLNFGTGQWQK